MRRVTFISLALLLAASLVHSAPNTSQRVQAFARLPDWTGLWETTPRRPAQLPRRMQYYIWRQAAINRASSLQPGMGAEVPAALAAAKAARTDAVPKGCGDGAPAYVRSFPNIMEGVMIFQVVVTPEETLFVMDHGEVRHIYTDRRAHPDKDDLWPTPLGDSIGHWEGHTLVIDTVARTAGPISMFAPVAELGEQRASPSGCAGPTGTCWKIS